MPIPNIAAGCSFADVLQGLLISLTTSVVRNNTPRSTPSFLVSLVYLAESHAPLTSLSDSIDVIKGCLWRKRAFCSARTIHSAPQALCCHSNFQNESGLSPEFIRTLHFLQCSCVCISTDGITQSS